MRYGGGTIEGAQTGKANRTDVSDVHNVFMTEAGGPKVRLVFRRDGDDFTNRGRRQEGHLGSVYMSWTELSSLWVGGGERTMRYWSRASRCSR
jgi:hypothetical protein